MGGLLTTNKGAGHIPSDPEGTGKSNIAWHPAFFQAIKLELREYRGALEFWAEYQLTSEPQRIDVVVIKKPPGVKIEKNIGQIFRGTNIMEYKSPDDSLGIADYYKVFGYAYQLVSMTGVDVDDVTLSFVVTKRPRALMDYLSKNKVRRICGRHGGVYYVHGEAFPVQIIESKRLGEEDNLWLKALSDKLGPATMGKILRGQEGVPPEEIGAYTYVVLAANPETLEELRKMGGTTLDQVLSRMGLVDAWTFEREKDRIIKEKDSLIEKKDSLIEEKELVAEERGKLIERMSEERIMSIQEMLQDKQPPETIARWVKAPLEQVLQIKEGLEKP